MKESMSETKFVFHTQISSDNSQQQSEKCAAMKNLQAVCFAMDDIRLFLDTHPFETQALNKYEEIRVQRNQLLEDFETSFGPVETYNVKQSSQWTWVDSPWPWEGV